MIWSRDRKRREAIKDAQNRATLRYISYQQMYLEKLTHGAIVVAPTGWNSINDFKFIPMGDYMVPRERDLFS